VGESTLIIFFGENVAIFKKKNPNKFFSEIKGK
jgi:hypothetical protein